MLLKYICFCKHFIFFYILGARPRKERETVLLTEEQLERELIRLPTPDQELLPWSSVVDTAGVNPLSKLWILEKPPSLSEFNSTLFQTKGWRIFCPVSCSRIAPSSRQLQNSSGLRSRTQVLSRSCAGF